MHNYNENATTFSRQQQITTNADNAFRNANQSGVSCRRTRTGPSPGHENGPPSQVGKPKGPRRGIIIWIRFCV